MNNSVNSNNIDESLIKVVSFNLKRNMAMAKKNKWEDRRELAAGLINELDAGIVGVQEMLPTMKSDFGKIFDDKFTIIGKGRYGGTKPSNDEHSDILLNNDKIEILAYKTFWLSKHPERPCSKAFLACFPRICTVAEILLKDSNQKIRVYNTHLDHISGFARKMGVKIILEYMDRYNNIESLPTILMGDMNSTPKGKAVQILRNNLHDYKSIHLTDVYTHYSNGKPFNTFHNFKGTQNKKKNPIDYMFVSDDFEIKKSYISTESYNGQYPSDHYPLVALLKLKPKLATVGAY